MNRIKQLRKFFGYTQDRLSKLLGVSRSTVAMWETTSQEPDYTTLSKLSEIFNISPKFVMGVGIFAKWDQIVKYYNSVSFELMRLIPGSLKMPSFCDEKYLRAWLDTRLYTDQDELQLARWFDFAVKNIQIIPPDDPNDTYSAEVCIEFTPEFEALICAENKRYTSFNEVNEQKSAVLSVPVLGDVAAGIPIAAIQDIVDYEELDQAMAGSGEYFGLRIRGDSMEPRICEGDVVIVRKQDDAETGDTVVALVNGDNATVKKLKKGPSGITLIPNNPVHDPMFYSNDEIAQFPVRILGKVVELRAKF